MSVNNVHRIDFCNSEIVGTESFYVSLHQGIEYLEEENAWGVQEPRGFIQYTLILDSPMEVRGTAVLSAVPLSGKPDSFFSIVVNGLVFVPEFEVSNASFQPYEWKVPSDFFFKGENTIITPLLPDSSTRVLVNRVSTEWG